MCTCHISVSCTTCAHIKIFVFETRNKGLVYSYINILWSATPILNSPIQTPNTPSPTQTELLSYFKLDITPSYYLTTPTPQSCDPILHPIPILCLKQILSLRTTCSFTDSTKSSMRQLKSLSKTLMGFLEEKIKICCITEINEGGHVDIILHADFMPTDMPNGHRTVSSGHWLTPTDVCWLGWSTCISY